MIDQPPPESATATRRQFFSTGVRCLAAGGLIALTTAQVFKGRRLAGNPNCIRLHTCADCLEFSGGCTREKAIAFRSREG